MELQQQQQPPAEPPSQSAETTVNIGVNPHVADVADRENSSCTTVLKRKRGRPAKGAPKLTPTPPPLKLKKDEEDVCFICFDGGSLVLCDRRSCPKAYHPACIKRDEAFFRSKAKWNCGWHICSSCEKSSHYMCYTCTYSLCKGCTKVADYVRVRGNKGLCGICIKTIKLIENSAEGNKGEVDFDDKSSWEYLFKVYWMYLKDQLSITFDEVLQAKNPWKVDVPVTCKPQTPDELYHCKVDNGSGSENSCIDLDSNNLKNKKCNGSNPQDLSTTSEPAGNICIIKNQINPNEQAIKDSTNAGVVRLGVSGAPTDISSLIQPIRDILYDKLWHYQDPTGKVQGPFSMFQLQQWNSYRYFPLDLRIWRVGEKQESSILLNGALSEKLNVFLPHQSEQQSLAASSVTLEKNKENSQNNLSNATRSEVCVNNQIVKQSREQKVDDTCTQSNGKDESVKSNGSHSQSPCLTVQTDGNNSEGDSENFERKEEESSKFEISCHDGPDIDRSLPSAAFSEKLSEDPSDNQGEGHGNEGNLEENGNVDSNKLVEGQSNSGQSDRKQSDTEENSGQSSGQNSAGKDESVKSNGSHSQSPCLTVQTDRNNSEGQSENFERKEEESSKCEISCHDGPDIDRSLPSAAFSEKLTEDPSDNQGEGHGNEGNLEENGNVDSNKLAEGQSNSGQSDQKQSDTEENSGQSSGQNWRGPDPDEIHPPCDASSWLAAIFGEPMVDESVSDLLAEVEAMESFGGLESPTSMMNCGEELTDGLSFPNGLGPMLDVGKGDSLSSTGDLHLPSQPTAAKETFQQADVHPHQKIFGEPSSGTSEAHFLRDWLEYKQSI